MAIRLKSKKNWTDLLRGRKFQPSNLPMVQDPQLLNYNSQYLSIYMHLQLPDRKYEIISVSLNGKVEVYDIRTKQNFWLKKYFHQFNNVMDKPWIVVNGDTNILGNLQLTDAELKAVQDKEVYVFFYEPLFLRSHQSNRCPAFFDSKTEAFFPELEWLQSFLSNHDHKFTAKVHVCDYGLREYLSTKRQHLNLKIKTWDIFVADTCRSLVEREIDRDPLFHEKKYPFQTQVQKKFICPNFRYEGFRELVVGYLHGSAWNDYGHVSFFHQHDRKHFLGDLGFDPQRLHHWDQISGGLEALQNKLPLTMDTTANKILVAQDNVLPDFDGVSNQRGDYRFHKWYDEAFLAIVNETRFSTLCGEISEKALIPIMYMRPFVIVGGPYMLRYLREMGFETFGDLWDESYDEIEDHGTRMQAVLHLLDSLLAKPLDEMQELLKKLEARLERNRHHLLFYLQKQMHEDLVKDD